MAMGGDPGSFLPAPLFLFIRCFLKGEFSPARIKRWLFYHLLIWVLIHQMNISMMG